MVKIGLFGGAFDPIHAGHVHIAELAQKELKLDKIYFIPLRQAVHKQQPSLPTETRLQNIEKMIKTHKAWEVLTLELERPGKSFTIDTLRQLLETRTDFTEADLYYIIGTDAFELFFTWKEPYKLLELLKFIVVARPGYDFSKVEKMFSSGENRNCLDRLFFIEDAGVDISSTKIRERKSANSA